MIGQTKTKVNLGKIPYTQRNNKVKELYATEMYSYNKLARIFKVSPQRIAQIIKNEAQVDGHK